MDQKEYNRIQIERARDHMAKHIDRVLDEIEEDHRHLTMSEVKEIKEAVEVIHMAHEMLMKM